MHRVARRAGRSDQLVAWIGDERCPGIAHQRDCMVAELSDDGIALALARMIVIAGHRHLRADMLKKLRGHSSVFGEDFDGHGAMFRRREG